MSNKKIPPVVVLGSDISLFDTSSESFRRVARYTEVYEEIHIIIPTTQKFSPIHQGTITVHPARGFCKTGRFFSIIKIGKRVVRTCRGASIIAQDPYMIGCAAFLLSHLTRIPFVVSVYGSNVFDPLVYRESFKLRVYALIGRKILKHASAIQADGKETVVALRERFGNKVFFKPMLPSDSSFFLYTDEREFKEGTLSVLFVGRLVPQKNIKLLLGIIRAAVARFGHKISFTIVGDGPERRLVEHCCEENNIKDFCRCIRHADRATLRDLYRTCDALLLTSRYEGFPRVFMEAALSKLPIITTQVSGVSDLVVDDISGFVMKQDASVDAWIEALSRLFDPSVRARFSGTIQKLFLKEYGKMDTVDYQRTVAYFLASKEKAGYTGL